MASASGIDIYIENDNLLTVVLTLNVSDGTTTYENAAQSVTYDIFDGDGSRPTGHAAATAMSYVAASNGRYTAVLPSTVTGLSESTKYRMVIAVLGENDEVAKVTVGMNALVRRARS